MGLSSFTFLTILKTKSSFPWIPGFGEKRSDAFRRYLIQLSLLINTIFFDCLSIPWANYMKYRKNISSQNYSSYISSGEDYVKYVSRNPTPRTPIQTNKIAFKNFNGKSPGEYCDVSVFTPILYNQVIKISHIFPTNHIVLHFMAD